jgi:hypothetical protein
VRRRHDCDNWYVFNLTAVYPSSEGSLLFAACSIAGVGFFFWGIHAIRKMREPLFNDEGEDKGKRAQLPFPWHRLTSAFAEGPNGESARANPFPIPSVENGVAQPLSSPDRVRIRLALCAPEEPFYRPSASMSTDAYHGQGSVTTPRTPPRAGGQSHRTSSRRSSGHVSPGRPYGEMHEYGANDDITSVGPSHEITSRHSSRHVSPMGGGRYGERHDYGVTDEHIRRVSPSRETSSRRSNRHVSAIQGRPYGERSEYRVNDEYGSVGPSRARGSPPYKSGTGHGPHQSTRRMNEDPMAYAHA